MSSNRQASDPNCNNHATRDSLLSGARRRDPDSWNRLCTLYEPLTTHWCLRFGVPKQDVQDVVQDVFASVARGLHSFHKLRPDDSFRAWLKTVTRNRATDWFRANAGKATATGGSVALKRMSELPSQLRESFEERDADKEVGLNRRLLDEALQTVQDKCDEHTWKAFWRVVVDGVPPVEVAAELDVPAVTVRVAKCRVLNRLRRELGDVDS